MRINDPRTALVLKRASLGPAALAARAEHMKRAIDNKPTLNSRVARLIIDGRAGPGVLGSLGDAAAKQVASGVVGIGARTGGISLASWAGAGAWAGPIGAAAGLVAGLLVGKLLTKNYLDVNQANAAADNEVAVFNRYSQVAGTIPGRAIGLDAMRMVYKGALHSGYFPANNAKLCFHNGCLKYNGHSDWIDDVFDNANNPDELKKVWQAYQVGQANAAAQAAAANQSAASQGMRTIGAPVSASMRATGRLFGLRGLGRLGDTTAPTVGSTGTPAQIFVDQYLIPASQAQGGGSRSWQVPQTTLAHQVLYDVADAFIANQVGGAATPAYVAVSSSLSPVPQAPQNVSPVDPTQGVTPNPNNPPPQGTSGNYPVTVMPQYPPPIDQLPPGGGVRLPTGSTVMQPGGALAKPLTAGLSDIPTWGWLLGAAAIAFAFMQPMKSPSDIAREARKG